MAQKSLENEFQIILNTLAASRGYGLWPPTDEAYKVQILLNKTHKETNTNNNYIEMNTCT